MDIKHTTNELNNNIPEIWEIIGHHLEDLVNVYDITINFHDISGISQVNPTSVQVMAPYAFHNNAFCNGIKGNPMHFATCIRQKARVIAHAEKTGLPFHGTCPMGYTEHVLPVKSFTKVIGILCIGGMSDSFAFDPVFLGDLKRLVILIEKAYEEYRTILDDRQGPMFDSNELRTQHAIRTALLFIKNHYNQDLTLQIIADHCYMNPSYLSTLFKKTLGIGISNYITQVRISQAAVLLATTNYAVTDIGKRIGYNDPAYFSRAFKRIEGVNPRAYRKKHKTT